jgi:ubiquinone/menaquinone biosynthesis C-methylase UbiE
MRLADLPVLAGELLLPRSLERRCEPSAAMGAVDQIEAYTRGAVESGPLAGAYCWQAARIAQAIAGRTRVLDLGCASGAQLVRTSRLSPQAGFVGLDLSPAMVEQARLTIASQGLDRVQVRQGDMTALPFPAHAFDAVISTMACHHLPDLGALRATLAEVARVLAPGGALYLADLLRPVRPDAVGYLTRRGNEGAPALLVEDYAHSLRAAFSAREWRQAAAGLLPQARLAVMRPWPVLAALATPLGPLPATARAPLRHLRSTLDGSGRETLGDLRLGFCGQGPDPFRGLEVSRVLPERQARSA